MFEVFAYLPHTTRRPVHGTSHKTVPQQLSPTVTTEQYAPWSHGWHSSPSLMICRGCSHSLQANAGTVPQTTSQPLPSTSLSIHCQSSLPQPPATTASPGTQPAHQSHQQNFLVSSTPRLCPLEGPDKWQCDRRRGSSVRSDQSYGLHNRGILVRFPAKATDALRSVHSHLTIKWTPGTQSWPHKSTCARVKDEEAHLHSSSHLHTRNHVRPTQTDVTAAM